MTKQAAKAKKLEVEKFVLDIMKRLDRADCSSYSRVTENAGLYFKYEEGSNEGCYMTFGDYEFRCHVSNDESMKLYVDTVLFWAKNFPG